MLDRLLAGRVRFPAAVNRLIDHVADRPMSILGRSVAARHWRPRIGRETPVSSVDRSAPLRVLVAPTNYSGQGRAWAAALERADPRIAASNMAIAVPGGFDFTADLVVPPRDYAVSRDWQRRQLSAVTEVFTHVLIEAEEPLFGRLLGRDAAREAAALGRSGVDVAFLAHGTDLRIPSRHADSTPWSPYRDPALYLDRLERLSLAHRELLRTAGRPVFVSTPDLLDDAPEGALWCPVVVDADRWSTPDRPRAAERGPLRVVHAPTSSLIKGTELIEPVLGALHEKGVIDYRRIVGVPWERMPGVLAEADVVLDQFRLGSYGVAACEAMASGRVVVGHVTDHVRKSVRDATGSELPVVEADPDTLESVLIALADDPDRVERLRRSGMAFVADVHDGRRSASVLIENWIAPGGAC